MTVSSPTLDVLLSRASTGQLQEPGPNAEQLELILQAGLRAPDHGKLRPWRFVLIRGEARTRLADMLVAALKRRDPEVTEALMQRQRDKVVHRPLIIALGVQVTDSPKVPVEEQVLSVGAAAMNMLNAAHALGLAGVWVTGPNSYDPSVAAALGFHAPDRLAGFLYLGTPMEEPRVVRRPDVAEHVREWTGAAA
jgi:nitroreductase